MESNSRLNVIANEEILGLLKINRRGRGGNFRLLSKRKHRTPLRHPYHARLFLRRRRRIRIFFRRSACGRENDRRGYSPLRRVYHRLYRAFGTRSRGQTLRLEFWKRTFPVRKKTQGGIIFLFHFVDKTTRKGYNRNTICGVRSLVRMRNPQF